MCASWSQRTIESREGELHSADRSSDDLLLYHLKMARDVGGNFGSAAALLMLEPLEVSYGCRGTDGRGGRRRNVNKGPRSTFRLGRRPRRIGQSVQ